MNKTLLKLSWWGAAFGLALGMAVLSTRASAQDQDQQDDPPSRVARIGYMEGSVSFQPAGEPDWVQAVPNRPMTTGDALWADADSRAELQLGSAVIRLNANTGFSFLNLDDRTVQIQLTSGSVNIRVRRLDQDDVFEIDTPNLAFSLFEPGSYRVEASEDGTYSVVSIREGEGESTGNGQTYTLHAGQRGTFSGTDSLNADVVEIGGPDQFDNWAYSRDHRYDDSRSARYLSHDVVGYEDLDDNGDWRDDSNYGHVWFPNRVAADWAPYRDGHWDWIAPWGYTWVDDSSWGYAPFHYGRWVTVGGRWGWVAGPVAVRAVYAPALVVFIGGGGGGIGLGANVGWFPLGPREVYVPSYHVSREYVNRVNVSNTTVNNIQITNVYNTTIINKTRTITNVTYANRNVRGAVTAVPQRTFASAQPVRRAAVAVNAQQIASASVNVRVAVAPTRESVLGAEFATANRVSAPPKAVMNRQVIAKRTPPPPPVPFAKQQQALSANPGEPLARSEVRSLRPAANANAHPMVRQAPPGKPATANVGRPGNQPGRQPGNRPGSQPNAARPGQPGFTPPASQPANRPANQPAPNERPGAGNPAQPNQPSSAQPNQPNNRPEIRPRNDRPETNQPSKEQADQPARNRTEPNQPSQAQPNQPNNRPEIRPRNDRPETNRPSNEQTDQPARNNRPEASQPPPTPANKPTNKPNNQSEPARPQPNRPTQPPERDNRPPAAQPNDRPANNRPEATRPESGRPESNRAQPNRPEPNGNQAAPQPSAAPQPDRSQQRRPPAETRPAPPPERPKQKPQTPEEKKKEEERKKHEQQTPPGE